MAARRTERAERPKFLLFERSEFEKFTSSVGFASCQCSAHGSQAIFCQPSPFGPFWGCQNGHPMVKKRPVYVDSLFGTSKWEILINAQIGWQPLRKQLHTIGAKQNARQRASKVPAPKVCINRSNLIGAHDLRRRCTIQKGPLGSIRTASSPGLEENGVSESTCARSARNERSEFTPVNVSCLSEPRERVR